MSTPLVMGIISHLIKIEGGYVNHPSDKGGPTKFGITEATAKRHGYNDRIKDLPQSLAEAIYVQEYWKPFEGVASYSQGIAVELFDTGVNMGVAYSACLLQRVLSAFNLQEALYPDLVGDGHIGPTTILALRAYLRKRGQEGERVLIRALNCLQGARYIELCEKREKNEDFVYGWIKERIS